MSKPLRNKEMNSDEVKRIIAEIVSCDPKALSVYCDLLDDFGMDSMLIIQMIVMVEEQSENQLPDLLLTTDFLRKYYNIKEFFTTK